MASGEQEPGVGNRVAAARRRRGWSREALAFHSGLSWAAISQIESGRRPNPRLDTLAALARALGVTVDYLAGGTGAPMLEHYALLHHSPDEFLDTAAPFFAGAIERGEASLVILSPERTELLRDRLGEDARQVTFGEVKEWYASPRAAVAASRGFAESSLQSGAPWLRIIAEIPWSGGSKDQIRLWARYEALLNLVFASTPATVVCPYDASSLSPEIVANARATHTHTVVGTETEPSSAYLDPGDFALRE